MPCRINGKLFFATILNCSSFKCYGCPVGFRAVARGGTVGGGGGGGGRAPPVFPPNFVTTDAS